MEESTDILIDHNHISNTTDSGIAVWSSHSVVVDGNEVDGACTSGYNESISIGGTDGLCSQNLYFQIAVDLAVPADHFAADHNLIDGYRGTEGEIYGDDYVEGDPLFVDPAAANWHLQQQSPAIDRAFASGAPNSDLDGQPRPYGAEYDIGADEYVASAELVCLPVVSMARVP